jgi:hypothetical protein
MYPTILFLSIFFGCELQLILFQSNRLTVAAADGPTIAICMVLMCVPTIAACVFLDMLES